MFSRISLTSSIPIFVGVTTAIALNFGIMWTSGLTIDGMPSLIAKVESQQTADGLPEYTVRLANNCAETTTIVGANVSCLCLNVEGLPVTLRRGEHRTVKVIQTKATDRLKGLWVRFFATDLDVTSNSLRLESDPSVRLAR